MNVHFFRWIKKSFPRTTTRTNKPFLIPRQRSLAVKNRKNHIIFHHTQSFKKTQINFNLFGWPKGFCHPLRQLWIVDLARCQTIFVWFKDIIVFISGHAFALIFVYLRHGKIHSSEEWICQWPNDFHVFIYIYIFVYIRSTIYYDFRLR